MKTLSQAAKESTCQKRIVVCILYDASGTPLAVESNRCSPAGGTCQRVGISNGQADYPVESTCNWTHAEIMALNALPKDAKPYAAVVYGHDFPCPTCEKALRAAGIEHIMAENSPELRTVGLRKAA